MLLRFFLLTLQLNWLNVASLNKYNKHGYIRIFQQREEGDS